LTKSSSSTTAHGAAGGLGATGAGRITLAEKTPPSVVAIPVPLVV
jgi:hypothetical protein